MIHLIERYILNNNNKAIEARQRHVDLLMLILLLLSSLLCLSRVVFGMYFATAT